MVPDGCTAATQHSTECLTPCDGVTGVWWGPCALGTLEHGEMVGPVCMAVTHYGCPRQPHLLDCLHPWQLSPLIQLGYASFFMKHWRKCEVNETGSAGSLANYLLYVCSWFSHINSLSLSSESCQLNQSMSTRVKVPWPQLFWYECNFSSPEGEQRGMWMLW